MTEEKRYKTNVFLQSKPLVVMVVVFVLCILYAVFSNPIETIAGKKKPTKPAAAPAEVSGAGAPAPSALAGQGSPQAANTQSNDTLCVKNEFVQNGVLYVVLNNGVTDKVTRGAKYEKCGR